MPPITAADVNDLRKRTNAPMMECKKALQEADGDMDKAVEHLRTKMKDIIDKKGERETAKGRIATFTLGYSHPIEFYLPDGIDMKVEKPVNNLTPLVLTGGDRQLLGQVAANMRALRPPDPYKNKGIRYANEALRKKAGKTGAAGGAK